MAEFHCTRRMEFVETDMAGIVHFSNFFRFMESAEVSFLQSLGLSVRYQYENQTYSLPRVAAACDFMQPVRFEDVVDIGVSVAKLGRSSITYAFNISHEGQLVAKGRVTCVFCRVLPGNKLESIDIPREFRAKLQAYLITPEKATGASLGGTGGTP